MPRKKQEIEKAQVEPILKTFEVRKYIKATNIVDAFNMDQITPPDSIEMVDDSQDYKVGFRK